MKIMGMILLAILANCSERKEKVDKKMNIAFYIDKLSTNDPAEIKYVDQYMLLENLYSRLIKIEDDGNIGFDLAKDYYWLDNKLIFILKDDVKTTKGQQIVAEDVVKSYKRLMIKNSSSHFNLKKFLGVKNLNSLQQDISQIYAEGNKVVFNLPEQNTLLVRALTSADFSIIPQSAIDPNTLDILNYDDTSGRYSAIEDLKGKKIILKKNIYYDNGQISEINLIHNRDSNGNRISVKMLEDGKVDFITMSDNVTNEEKEKLSQNSRISIHSSLPFNMRVMLFTNHGLSKFSKNERKCIANKIQMKLDHTLKKMQHNYTVARQIFPINAEGYLVNLKKEEDCLKDIDLNSIAIGALASNIDAHPEIVNALGLKLNTVDHLNFTNDYGLNDLIFMAIDSAYHEDVSLISMFSKLKMFGPLESDKALDEYVSIKNKEDRLDYIKTLHQATLSEQYIIPLFVTPYWAFFKNNLEVPYSKFHLDIDFSKIKIR